MTVSPSGPTLTSLLPATLQVTQGAAGTLTVTLSAAQATDTLVSLASSHPSIVSLPPGAAVTVPAGQGSQPFAVFGTNPVLASVSIPSNCTPVPPGGTVHVPFG